MHLNSTKLVNVCNACTLKQSSVHSEQNKKTVSELRGRDGMQFKSGLVNINVRWQATLIYSPWAENANYVG